MRTIEHWTIKVTWSDGQEEFLDYIPHNDGIENYLNQLEEEENYGEYEDEEEEEEDEDEN